MIGLPTVAVTYTAAVLLGHELRNLDPIETPYRMKLPLRQFRNDKLPNEKLLFVAISVDGHRYWLCVDSGASLTVLNPTVAKRHNLKASQYALAVGIGGGHTKSGLSSIKSLSLGEWNLQDVPVMIPDAIGLFKDVASDDGAEIAGLLGADFLDRYSATIDFRDRSLFLEDSQLRCRSMMGGCWRPVSMSVGGKTHTAQHLFNGIEVRIDKGMVKIGTGSRVGSSYLTPAAVMTKDPFSAVGVFYGTVPKPGGEGAGVGQYTLRDNELTIVATASVVRANGVTMPPDAKPKDSDLVTLTFHRHRPQTSK